MESKNHIDNCQPDVVMANLDKCTDGDAEFRRELAQLLANNITEMIASIEKSVQVKDPTIMIRSVHKTKTTLTILNDAQINEEINIVETKLKEPSPRDLEIHVEKLINRCAKTVHILNTLAA
ncbi:MAG TPA: hypothetical protein VE467_06735 [Chryseolinea sp.]|jgi:hypothetical protein|nr:hypothetical protein [Chryseolinea sp.]